MSDGTLRWPKIMPAWCYRDPALQGDGKVDGVSRETIAAVHAPAPTRPVRDRYFRQASRLVALETARFEIQKLRRR